uniref:Neurotransmitter-gated ion-channel transmembrane domain-containing protein n=1 Tax=Plectus sambesii TaxID=2011161 RepID=A0A914XLG0_9BILA
MFAPFSNTGEREEKVTLGLTSLLAIAVILSSVASEMPKSTKLPLLGNFVIGEMALCTLGILVALLIMFVHHHAYTTHRAVPIWLAKILHCEKTAKERKGSLAEEINATKNALEEPKSKITQGDPVASALFKMLGKVNRWIEVQERKTIIHDQWDDICTRLDLLFLFAFQVFNISLLLYFIS